MTRISILQTANYQAFTIREFKNSIEETILHSFTGAERAGRALPGDFVEWQADNERCALVNRTIHPPLTGLLDVCSKTIYGMTSRHVPIFLFYPYDKRYPPMRVGCSTADRSINLLVTVRFEDWPAGETFPRANLETVIGSVGNLINEAKALVSYASAYWRPKPSYTAPIAVAANHRSLPTTESAPWVVFHIDPAGCRDVDDIIGIQER
jgi:exoribonuclease R